MQEGAIDCPVTPPPPPLPLTIYYTYLPHLPCVQEEAIDYPVTPPPPPLPPDNILYLLPTPFLCAGGSVCEDQNEDDGTVHVL